MKKKYTNNNFPVIGPWAAATIVAPKKDIIEQSYIDWLDYSLTFQGVISNELASSWGAEKLAGSNFSCLRPSSGKKFQLRIIEYPISNDYKPLTTYGWNAVELVVKDTDKLEKKLSSSPFRIIGKPSDLKLTKQIRAMQLEGLANEIFYLTMFKEKISKYDLPDAESDIDNMFIAVLATDNPVKVQNWYLENFGIQKRGISKTNISVLDRSFGFEMGTGEYGLTVIPLANQSLIEVDEYPKIAKDRNYSKGMLPPGNSLMSVFIDSINSLIPLGLNKPTINNFPPYNGARSLTVRGAAGELIEFIEK
ncbi:MAG: hypothetical protein CFH01_00185 [Alphaproteobacteria bacterium MarineAlpha2_Bin1]|nr:MAG: hypothetical protein CFH01_00185 [Alphaproteobacteria bacterium MarineAlpha2_Bin1]|tara:strand:+ start:481 stop:1401 length:921 start_codon:yes stop_codon:yes gene_type:complete